MKQSLTPFFFYLFAAVSVLPGIFVLASRDIVRAAFWLLAALSGFAGLYVLLGADFLAVTQVVVYLGGILILILFGVMLTHRDPALVRKARQLNILVPGLAGGATLAVAGAAAVARSHFAIAAVTLATIQPPVGPTHGGFEVTIQGENLAYVMTTSVTLGGVPLTNVSISPDGTSLKGTAGAHPAGAVALSAGTSAVGTLSAPRAFEYGEDAHKPTGPREVHASRALPLAHESFRGSTRDIGKLLVGATGGDEDTPEEARKPVRSFLLPFEIASVLLLAALVGAAYVARRGGDPVEERMPGEEV